jgi:predicted amidohydrolase YtcJ
MVDSRAGDEGGRCLAVADRVHAASGTAPVRGPLPDALLYDGGRILEVGTRAALEPKLDGGRFLDLSGCTLTPGFTDAHIHLLDWAFARLEVDLSACATPATAVRPIAAAAAATGPDQWVRGRGWSLERWGGAPPLHLLDEATGPVPAALYSQDMHALWVNSAALARAGVDRDTPDPGGGRIGRAADGSPSGVLYERAAALLAAALPPYGEQDAAHAVLDAQRALHRWGVTGVQIAVLEGPMHPNPLRVLTALREDGRLRLRVLQHLPVALLDEAIALGLRSGLGDDWIRIGALKMFLDGTLGSRTAWLAEPYAGTSADRGMQLLPAETFRAAVARGAAAGLASMVHAIGDSAVALALDVLAEPTARGPSLPHRIEHVQLMPAGRAGDAGRAGIVCSMQPSHLMTDRLAADRHWGPERASRAFACRSLAEAGAVLAFGSDAPVDPPDPRWGLYAASFRLDRAGTPAGGWHPSERLERHAALRAYTFGPAYAAGVAGRLGCLAPGAAADFVAWRGDPLAVPAAALLELAVGVTVMNGEVVWSGD